MSDTTFESMEAFLAWLGRPGSNVSMPFPGAKEWSVLIKGGDKPSLEITSPFYTVKGMPPYGAPKVVGHHFPFGGVEASGMVEFGFREDDASVMNRRRITSEDRLEEGKTVIGTIIAQPDRVHEVVAVVISEDDRISWSNLRNVWSWVSLFDSARDGVELCAVQMLFNHFHPRDS